MYRILFMLSSKRTIFRCCLPIRSVVVAGFFCGAMLLVAGRDLSAQTQGAHVRGGMRTTEARAVLARRVKALRAEVNMIDARNAELRKRIPSLVSRVDKLADQLASLAIPEPQEDETEEIPDAKPRRVPFRPPLLRREQLETPLGIVCVGGRISILDFDEFIQEFSKLKSDQTRLKALLGGRDFLLDSGDYSMTVSVRNNRLSPFEATRKQNHPGESVEHAVGESSKVMRRLKEYVTRKRIKSNQAIVQFFVYPDSFAEFRDVRKLIWQEKFAVNWIPMSHGEKLLMGGGSGGIQRQ